MRALEHVYRNDPAGPLAARSLLFISDAYVAHGRKEDASFYYERLRRDYSQELAVLTRAR